MKVLEEPSTYPRPTPTRLRAHPLMLCGPSINISLVESGLSQSSRAALQQARAGKPAAKSIVYDVNRKDFQHENIASAKQHSRRLLQTPVTASPTSPRNSAALRAAHSHERRHRGFDRYGRLATPHTSADFRRLPGGIIQPTGDTSCTSGWLSARSPYLPSSAGVHAAGYTNPAPPKSSAPFFVLLSQPSAPCGRCPF